MSAYLIIQATVHDWQKFAKYTEVVPPLVEKFGGQYIAMGQPELIEGQDAPKSVVISQWPDCQAAHNFWQSPEYVQAKKHREGTGQFSVLLIDGLSQTTLE
ncbi:DUF1330 domain-containing protein [Paraglaciecola chathamensis]|jgi:uncharacterized protein (DUF1330 family)|uniref:DUF1330 domain-containing protein n=2 Tax=Paraglaciecola chathamensis TaxID=368405 RepID=A0A8H9IAI0_9ALTE|nr:MULTISPECIES: DUF1330 domain-containing protein [Paraglaciecola]GAC11675.1 hypothetical protein GCHA_3745 [Paraglaciecola chathamensis S18K6]GGZ54613.1 hypothetical protein GCM10011274_10690 [Paraglaciecola oceanifecundans]|tara:strand:- start:2872 stop:3174 length:303 start_codon:yes stop_codon:yes gene_type:complete